MPLLLCEIKYCVRSRPIAQFKRTIQKLAGWDTFDRAQVY